MTEKPTEGRGKMPTVLDRLMRLLDQNHNNREIEAIVILYMANADQFFSRIRVQQYGVAEDIKERYQGWRESERKYSAHFIPIDPREFLAGNGPPVHLLKQKDGTVTLFAEEFPLEHWLSAYPESASCRWAIAQ